MTHRRPEREQSSLGLIGAWIDAAPDQPLAWSAGDLRAMFVHLLATDPLGGGDGPTKTIEALLGDPAPPLARLRALKNFAKRRLGHGDRDLPAEIARLLYVLILARARLAGHATISRLSDSEFEHLARWGLAQGWAPAPVHGILRAAVGGLGRDGHD